MGGVVRLITRRTINTLYCCHDMSEPHPDLVPLLQKHGIDWGIFRKRGRPPTGVRAKRAALVTELHEAGYSWSQMCDITGLSNGGIQRLTEAKGCAAVQAKRKVLGKAVGTSWAGKKRPGQLEKQWANGIFDSLRGRVRSSEERAKLKASWTPERRCQAAKHSRERVWGDPEVLERLLSFHRDPKERAQRSRAQALRMKKNPTKYLRGRAQWVNTPKGLTSMVFVRSSYEAAALVVLEADPQVVRYEFERRIILPGGRWVLPDFVIEYEAAACLTMMHLSRLAEEIVLWSSAEFNFIELDEAYATSSSIMPQKKNPDVAELVRGKVGRVYGRLMALLTTMKGLPLSYNRDIQEDKEGLFDAVDTLLSTLEVFAGMVNTLRVKTENTGQAVKQGYILATDLADYLVKKGVPFRTAHETVARLVSYAVEQNKSFSELSLNEYNQFSPLFGEDVYSITVESSIAAKDVTGGTAPKRVEQALATAKKIISSFNNLSPS